MQLGGLVGDGLQRGPPHLRRARVVADAVDVDPAEGRGVDPNRRAGHREGGPAEFVAGMTQHRQDSPQRQAALRRAEQAPVVGRGVPTDGDTRVRQAADHVVVSRNDGADERLGGAPDESS